MTPILVPMLAPRVCPGILNHSQASPLHSSHDMLLPLPYFPTARQTSQGPNLVASCVFDLCYLYICEPRLTYTVVALRLPSAGHSNERLLPQGNPNVSLCPQNTIEGRG